MPSDREVDDFELRLASFVCHGRRLANVQGTRIAVSRPRQVLSMRVIEGAPLVARIFRDLRQRPAVPARAGATILGPPTCSSRPFEHNLGTHNSFDCEVGN